MPGTPRATAASGSSPPATSRSRSTEFPNPGRPPVVLLHGIGSRGESWWPVIDPLAERFHLYQLDLRGHGASGKPIAATCWSTTPRTSTPPRRARAARSRASWATRWGRWSRSSGPASIRRGRRRWWSRIRRCARHRPSSRLRRLAAARGADPGAGGRLVPAGIPGLERRRLPAPRRDDHLDGARRLRRAARRGRRRAGQRRDRPHAHPRRRADRPTLLVHGNPELGGMVPPEDVERFRQSLPHARVVAIADAGHNLHRDATDAFLAAVIPFLDGEGW